MSLTDARQWVERDWEALRRLKRRHWAERYRAGGAAATLAAATALWEHVRRVRPDWPTERELNEDLQHHIELKQLIDRAAHAFPCR